MVLGGSMTIQDLGAVGEFIGWGLLGSGVR
jgi:hypothetical protein